VPINTALPCLFSITAGGLEVLKNVPKSISASCSTGTSASSVAPSRRVLKRETPSETDARKSENDRDTPPCTSCLGSASALVSIPRRDGTLTSQTIAMIIVKLKAHQNAYRFRTSFGLARNDSNFLSMLFLEIGYFVALLQDSSNGLAIAAQVDAFAYDFNTTISLTVTGIPFGYFVALLQDSSNGLAIAAQVDAFAYDFNTTISPDISITSFFFSVSLSCGVLPCALSSFWKASSAFLS